ncbi:MAG: recombinase family protein [Alphaproteobacteria bacterium]|nr:recombinase family protein [Alphaproteobacteria bacterium]
MNVVLLCRVSTNHQDYHRQVAELTEFSNHQGWKIEKVFANKISGAKKIEERPEIQEMIAYVREHAIDKVLVLEISRLGRNTLEALKVIQTLNDAGICLYVKNYNLETIVNGKINSVASLICTILLEVAQMERLTIVERMTSGRNQYIRTCREKGIKMGRPATYRKSDEEYRLQYAKAIFILRKGTSLRNTQAITNVSIKTLRKLKEKFITQHAYTSNIV